MLFLSYQPMFKDEKNQSNDNISDGKVRLSAILRKDENLVKQLGYNPYWAIGGEDDADIITSSLTCAPNFPAFAFIFQTDNYIRINKIKWYQAISKEKNPNPLDYEDPQAEDNNSEFLVKDFSTPFYVTLLPMLMESSTPIRERIADGALPLSKLPEDTLDYWELYIDNIKSYIKSFSYDRDAIVNGLRVDESFADAFSGLLQSKMLFELTVLPMELAACRSFLAPADDGGCKLSTINISAFEYTYRNILPLVNRFTLWTYSDCPEDEYYKIYADLKSNIINSPDLIESLSKDGIPYPNASCPCGSGQKFKKCHGRVKMRNMW